MDPSSGFDADSINKSELKTQELVVGAPRFELGTSCAQASRAISWKSFLFNLGFENKRVRKIFDSGTMYGNVDAHAWSPLNFPHSERKAKVCPGCVSPYSECAF
jgi:hypothetical protein